LRPPPTSTLFPYTTLFRSRGHHGETMAGVARGRLDDRAAGLELAGPFGLLDHGQPDAVLDAAAGVQLLELGQDRGPNTSCDLVQDRKSTRLNSSHQIISYA